MELETFDVVINKDVMNYVEHKLKPQPAKEIIDFKRFNIAQLKILLEELLMFCNKEKFIKKSTFIDVMIKKYVTYI